MKNLFHKFLGAFKKAQLPNALRLAITARLEARGVQRKFEEFSLERN